MEAPAARAGVAAGLLLFPLLLLVATLGCTTDSGRVLVPESGTFVARSPAELAQTYPLADGQNILPTLLGRTEALSYHFIQIRDREPPHAHATHDLVVTLVRGRGTLNVGGRALPMRTGDTAFVPRGQVHFFVNTRSNPAAAFVTFAPPYDGTDNVPASIP